VLADLAALPTARHHCSWTRALEYPAPATSSAERGTAAWFTRRVTQVTRTGSVRQLGRERRDLDRIEPSNVLWADLGGSRSPSNRRTVEMLTPSREATCARGQRV
jgi:hypothetical protein